MAAHCYLDNSATTCVSHAAAQKALEMMTVCYGNPSSLHKLGIEAEKEMTAARRAVSKLFGLSDSGADLSCVTFTSSGTEANNLALFGAAASGKRNGRHIVTTALEHPSVLQTMRQLEQEGFDLTVVSPDKDGDISAQALADACRPDTILVSAMLVNNEIGTLLPIKDAVPLIRKRSPKALIHCDAVQAAGKLPLKVLSLDVDLMSISGHKLHAPKGVGALYVKKGVRLLPRTFGGGQERGLRSGTESTPLIAAFGQAVNELKPSMAHFDRLCRKLTAELTRIDGVVLHTPKHAVPYIVNLSVCGFKSETLVHFLASRGVFVSAGSACSKGHDSPVLQAIGLPKKEIDSALRISLCDANTEDDIDLLISSLQEAVATLARAD